MLNHKHYIFRYVDSMPKDDLRKAVQGGGKLALQMFLKAKMYYYVAQNNLQSDMKGDETSYCNMLAEEYAV